MGMKIPITYECDGVYCDKTEIIMQEVDVVDSACVMPFVEPPHRWRYSRFGEEVLCYDCSGTDQYRNNLR